MSIYSNNTKYLTLDKLILKSQSKNVILETDNDKIKLSLMLENISYSTLIKGYKNTNLVDEHGCFLESITPYELLELHRINADISSILFKYVLYVEQELNSVLSSIISEKFSTDTSRDKNDIDNPNDFLYKHNYNMNNPETMNVLKKLKKHTTRPIKYTNLEYYVNNKNYIPPWVLLDSIYLSDSIGLYKIMKTSEKDEVIKKMLSTNTNMKTSIKKDMFIKFLNIIKNLRNKLAHSNMLIKSELPDRLIFKDVGEYTNYTLVSGSKKDKKYRDSIFFSLMLSVFIPINLINIQLDFYKDIIIFLNKYKNTSIANKDIFELLNIPKNIHNRMLNFLAFKYNRPIV
ncbi:MULTISPECIES: Abi family protein [unclassified Gemella]|uniref:Abi family protein n=1 Tax=unclassified Gemella TaxID=2624949 RepID=UPI001073930E|nr:MULTISPECIES: Abi family protein [unclassified Gemella]MBF0709765.1 Abi family protein [Gemella sp. GL1.1]MBF0747147.1 Abi family protein [Gemella sp. 19428wG2_WT2a]NYS27109.1 Abi family protein [Gemella sp. GL1]TFU58387.1 Abi family protein [Gemella sp. WT2a]